MGHARVMGLSLPHGGHITHGHMTPSGKCMGGTSIYFESMPYYLDESSGTIDYDRLARQALDFRPKMLIVGASAYPRDFDYARMRQIADSVGAYLMADMAHISGLVASEHLASPFDYCDVVSTTTHKSLRGPRGGMIFSRRCGVPAAGEPEFRDYQERVIANCRALAGRLGELGYDLVSGGTDNHLLLVDLKGKGVDGSRVEKILDLCHITLNKNSVPGDRNMFVPGGMRIGTPAMTTRGLGEDDFRQVADLVDRGVRIAVDLKAKTPGEAKLKDFMAFVGNGSNFPEITQLRDDVHAMAGGFPMPGDV